MERSTGHLVFSLSPGTTSRVQLLHLENTAVPGKVTTALVVLTLTHADTDLPLAGQVWPVTLAPVPYSEGDYEATLPATLVITVGQRVIGTIIALADGGAKRTFIERGMVTDG